MFSYNDQVLLPHAIEHYNRMFNETELQITLVDNQSTDKTLDLAAEKKVTVRTWVNDGQLNEGKLTSLKNEIWKNSDADWVIVCDVDEWLMVTPFMLQMETHGGVTVLQTQGYEVVGSSIEEDLSDIDPLFLTNAAKHNVMSKAVCFNPTAVREMNYLPGCHQCKPEGRVKVSHTVYTLKHLNFLGTRYLLKKYRSRAETSKFAKHANMAIHYTTDYSRIQMLMQKWRKLASPNAVKASSPEKGCFTV